MLQEDLAGDLDPLLLQLVDERRDLSRGGVQAGDLPVGAHTGLFEYEDVLYRKQAELGVSDQDIEAILDNLCDLSDHQPIYYLWRTFLPDPKDDHILEVAVASQTPWIVTHNLKDFSGIAKTFGIRAIPPKVLLEDIR